MDEENYSMLVMVNTFSFPQHCEPSTRSAVKRSARCLSLGNVMSVFGYSLMSCASLDYCGSHVHCVIYFRLDCANLVSTRQNGARAERN